MPTEARRTDWIGARVRPKVKQTIEEAATILGITVSSFVSVTAQERASEVVRAYRHSELSAVDSARFAAALLEPGAPNAALRQAMARHKAEVEP